MPHKNAASVLPEPVGERISVCEPVLMAGHPRRWGLVGETNDVSNHVRTGDENGLSASSVTSTTLEPAMTDRIAATRSHFSCPGVAPRVRGHWAYSDPGDRCRLTTVAFFVNLRNRTQRSDEERGAILVMTALVMLLLLFIAAFATDLGAWFRQGQAQQQAADVGALNGIQAYDRGVKDYFDGLSGGGVDIGWQNATDAQKINAERAGMEEAVETVIGLLETSGLSFTINTVPTILSEPTADELPGGETHYEIVADDGTVVTIRRVSVTAPDGTVSNAISVSLTAEGEQYFSSLLREAPEITRAATSTLSNCGATCERSFEIEPPFSGFDVVGSGDGYAPLLWGEQEIWAVNHHSNANLANRGLNGDIVCMDREAIAPCAGQSLWSLEDYHTTNHPTEVLSQTHGKIYFGATNRHTLQAGIACFDVVAENFCSTEFLPFFDASDRRTFGSPMAGVWENQARTEIWAINDRGLMMCITPDMAKCSGGNGTGTWDSAVVGELGIRDVNGTAWGRLVGDRLFLANRSSNNTAFMHCFNIATRTSCWGGSGFVNTGQQETESIGFLLHNNGSATPSGFCVASPDNGNSHTCLDFNGAALPNLPGLNTALADLGDSWKGQAFVFHNSIVLFAGGRSDTVSCYNLVARQYCGSVTGRTLTGGTLVEPYAFAQVTDECLVGLGDESVFFSINPVTLLPCQDTKVSVPIFPCECADGGNRWGEIRLPSLLLSQVDGLRATILTTDGGPAVSPALDNFDALANNGVLDLTGVDQNIDMLYLELGVEARLVNGQPLWEEPITADLQIVVQPTLVE